ncbi:kelch-like protein 24 [Ruditapes philippinarum]|uniref:kelch-like protein 24 n=1 Tax=Ruditapes philippinarum TaxID=129788 RepID=UPI00295B70CB|nr:kelch-like protein 24 [Ruditapes philippinarum]XP_060565207.1 kelch-like protein 24 [Ruditapes philippinarum]XP_060565208.1 kelch-like protein 24 [Ruditapes philippinarum]
MCTSHNRDFTQRDEFSDVTIKVEGTSLFVHRQYLAEWSGVWRKLFLSECEDPSASIEIVLEDKTLEDVTQLLQCIYSSQNYITDSNVQLMLEFAEEYEMANLKLRCEEYLLTQEVSIESLVIAEKHSLKNLFKQCMDFAKTQTMEDLERHPLKKEISEQTLIAIYKEKVYMMRDYANELKQNESKLKRQNDQLSDEKDGILNIFKNMGKLWEMPNKRCYKHMTDEKFDFTCRDCNEKMSREVRRMCNDGQHVRRYFILNNKSR